MLAWLVRFRELWLTRALGIASVLSFGRDGWADGTPNGGLQSDASPS